MQLPSLFNLNPEFISVHIPKTAGSSFHRALKQEYGIKLKHIYKQEEIRLLSKGKSFRTSHPFVKVVHGHIRPHQNWKVQYPKAKWICWLRDPVDRVISAYYHLKRTQEGGDRNQKLFKSLQPSLEEFIENPEFEKVIHIYQHFLEDFNPSDFVFIGRMEFYAEDLQYVKDMMNAKNFNVFETNIGYQKKIESEKENAFIRKMLQKEYEVYQEFRGYFHG